MVRARASLRSLARKPALTMGKPRGESGPYMYDCDTNMPTEKKPNLSDRARGNGGRAVGDTARRRARAGQSVARGLGAPGAARAKRGALRPARARAFGGAPTAARARTCRGGTWRRCTRRPWLLRRGGSAVATVLDDLCARRRVARPAPALSPSPRPGAGAEQARARAARAALLILLLQLQVSRLVGLAHARRARGAAGAPRSRRAPPRQPINLLVCC